MDIDSPSNNPSTSNSPSFPPSFPPTNVPTKTSQPTDVPSNSGSPSYPPSASPTYAPVPLPSSMPSFAIANETYVIRNCEQILEVQTPELLTEVQVGIYQFLMESYTANIGEMVTKPQIITTSLVTKQDLAGGRRRRGDGGDVLFQRIRHLLVRTGSNHRDLQTTTAKNLLVVSFTMEYKSRYGYDVDTYPSLFQSYVNDNLEQVTIDMQERFLPVVEALNVIVYKPKEPTIPPSNLGAPSSVPTPSTFTPSYAPSIFPSPVPSLANTSNKRTNFIVGLAAGLGGAVLIVCFLIWNMKRKNEKKKKAEDGDTYNNYLAASRQVAEMEAQISTLDEGYEMRAEEVMGGGGGLHRANSQGSHQGDIERTSSPQGIISNPSMVSGGESFSSDPDDYPVGSGVQLNTLQDEFDNYKNQDLEYMRSGVEESVYGAEGMMSLAMTRALMDDEDGDVNPTWGGAEDPESIEANALCETNDWLRKNEHSTLDERNLFFQELLNRMVITVRRGMINPSDGTRAIHCCAAMLGLELEKDTPNSVLLVHGMRKTNDLTLGRSYLVDAFKSFGEIEGAAIAPSNRGFGFVRFVSPKSVQRALERFRVSEIEVQDVSVMIKSLKSDAS